MSTFTGQLECLRCAERVGARQSATPCPRCVAEGVAVACLPVYDGEFADGDPSLPGVFASPARLPIDVAGPLASRREGSTPLVECAGYAARVGLDTLYIKDESRNPTWSYKDRLAAVAVTQALQAGSAGVVVSSTGNHGAAIAAYAAAAHLPCVVLTVETVPLEMKTLMQAYGAVVVALRTGPERWQLMGEMVRERNLAPMSGYVDPPLGSNPYGVEGYKSMAYEMVDSLGGAPDVVVVPTAYGDGIAGITRGFDELVARGTIRTLPRMMAADPLGAYHAAQQHGFGVRVPFPSTVSFSTGTPVATYQGYWALEHTGGVAVPYIADDEILAAQLGCAATEGLYLENSSATALAVVSRLVADGTIGSADQVVVIGTSTGLKDINATASCLDAVPVVEPTLESFDTVAGHRAGVFVGV